MRRHHRDGCKAVADPRSVHSREACNRMLARYRRRCPPAIVKRLSGEGIEKTYLVMLAVRYSSISFASWGCPQGLHWITERRASEGCPGKRACCFAEGDRQERKDGAGVTVIMSNGPVPLREGFASRMNRPLPPWWYKSHNVENHTVRTPYPEECWQAKNYQAKADDNGNAMFP